jgi:hypothetical protein
MGNFTVVVSGGRRGLCSAARAFLHPTAASRSYCGGRLASRSNKTGAVPSGGARR